MSRVDEELNAVAEEAPPVIAAEPSPRPVRPPPKGNLGLLLVLVAAGIGVVALVMSFRDAAVYAKTVDQLMGDKTRLAGRAVRVEGTLVKGTLIHHDSPTCEYLFEIQNAGSSVPVRYGNCVVPDTFRDVPGMDVKVTVEGKLLADGHFEATEVMAKCPSKYEMKQRADGGEKMPHQAVD